MKKTKLLKKWKNLEKSDKVYYLVIFAFILSAVIAMFIGLAIYGWNLIDLLKDSRTIFLTFIATILLVCIAFFLLQRNMTRGTRNTDKKIFTIVLILLVIGVMLSTALIVINWGEWTNGTK